MKATRWEKVFSGSERVSWQKSTLEGSEESLFSLLLKVETRLNDGVKHEFQHGHGQSKSPKLRSPTRSAPTNLSRYIE